MNENKLRQYLENRLRRLGTEIFTSGSSQRVEVYEVIEDLVKLFAIPDVMPRSLMKEQLHLKTGSRTLNVRGVNNMDMPHVIISCIEEWQPDPDDEFGEAEIDDASYYLTSKEIDMLIAKLREGKAFLNGA